MIKMARMDKVTFKIACFGYVGFRSSGQKHDGRFPGFLRHVVGLAEQSVFFLENDIGEPIGFFFLGHRIDANVRVDLTVIRSVLIKHFGA